MLSLVSGGADTLFIVDPSIETFVAFQKMRKVFAGLTRLFLAGDKAALEARLRFLIWIREMFHQSPNLQLSFLEFLATIRLSLELKGLDENASLLSALTRTPKLGAKF